MKRLLLLPALTALAGFGFTVTAQADAPFTCADVTWTTERLSSNPNIGSHCLGIVERGGEYYAKLTAQVVRQGVNSTVVRYKNPDGSWGGSERAYPPRGFTAEIAGETVRVSDLAPRQEVNIYVRQEGNFSYPEPAAVAQAAPPPEPEPAPAPEPEPEPAYLPSTASQVPMLALLGSLMLLLGGAVHVLRTRS